MVLEKAAGDGDCAAASANGDDAARQAREQPDQNAGGVSMRLREWIAWLKAISLTSNSSRIARFVDSHDEVNLESLNGSSLILMAQLNLDASF
jgi:hypothetical protein